MNERFSNGCKTTTKVSLSMLSLYLTKHKFVTDHPWKIRQRLVHCISLPNPLFISLLIRVVLKRFHSYEDATAVGEEELQMVTFMMKI